jgi:hypothetical protein
MMCAEHAKELKQNLELHHQPVVDAVDQDFRPLDKVHLQFNKYVEIVMVLVQL